MAVEGVVGQAGLAHDVGDPRARRGAAALHDRERGIEQPAHLVGVLALPFREGAPYDAISDAGVGRVRGVGLRYCVLDSQNHILAVSRGRAPWRGISRPTPSTRRSWTGPTQFVREEVEPLDLAFPHQQFTPLDEQAREVIDPLKQEVRAPGPVGDPPRPRARRPGLRPAEAGAAQRDPRPLGVGADRSSAARPPTPATPRSSPTTARRAEGALPPAAARRRVFSCYSMTEPHARRRPDACSRPGPSGTATSG